MSLTRSSANFGSVAVGSTGKPRTVNVQFNAAVTPASVTFPSNSAFTSTGGTCAANTTTEPVRPAPSMLNSLLQPPGFPSAESRYPVPQTSLLATTYLSGTAWRRHHPRSRHVTKLKRLYLAQVRSILGRRCICCRPGCQLSARIRKLPRHLHSSLAPGLNKPAGVAVDGAGDVIIADTAITVSLNSGQ